MGQKEQQERLKKILLTITLPVSVSSSLAPSGISVPPSPDPPSNMFSYNKEASK